MEQRIVSIWLPFLATDWHVRKQPALRGQPFVLKAPVHNRVVVTAASPEAMREGIRPGMALADARALLPSLQALDDKPGLSAQLLRRMAEWCIRFTPIAAPDPPAGILLDATGCAHLWGGEEAYLTDILNRFKERGYAVRVAASGTAGASWALARCSRQQLIMVPGGEELKAIAPLPVASLRIEGETAEKLVKLGLRQVGDLLKLPRRALRRRFGNALLLALCKAGGEVEERLQPVYIPEPYSERLPCLEPVVTRTGIEIALEQLLGCLCNRLRREGKGLRRALFRCYRVDGATQGIEIDTSRPSQSEDHLFGLFSLKLGTIEPALGIELFLLEAPVVEEADAAQETFWKKGGKLDDPQVSELIDRLAGKLGSEKIFRYLPAAHYWPERSVQPALSLQQERSTEWRLDRPRPLHLLHPPEPIEVTAPVPDYPPMLFRHRGVLHRVLRADGPERIEQEWWISDGPHRDYYCVEDEEGRRYWLFRLGHYTAGRTEQWFLHGMFA